MFKPDFSLSKLLFFRSKNFPELKSIDPEFGKLNIKHAKPIRINDRTYEYENIRLHRKPCEIITAGILSIDY